MTFNQLTNSSFYGVFEDITNSDYGFTTYSLDKQIRETFVYLNEFVGFRCSSTEVEELARRYIPSVKLAVQREFTEEERLDMPIRVLTRMFSHVFDAFYADCAENILDTEPCNLPDLYDEEAQRFKYYKEQESYNNQFDNDDDISDDDFNDYQEFGKTKSRRGDMF
jgi:hypothetical protein